jgi:HPt (histidine-containing phosphotransfer) domain-containing protein
MPAGRRCRNRQSDAINNIIIEAYTHQKERVAMTPVETPLDRELLDESAEYGLDDLQELIELYFDQADEIMGQLQTAVQTGAAKDIDQLAHKLAGSSAVVGVKAVIQPLRTLEKQGHEGQLAGSEQLLADATERLELCRRLLAEYMTEKTGH